MRLPFQFLCILFSWVLYIVPVMAADDLCPQDSAAVKNVPGDVAGVQADIDRLNLCVERAKLLKQMDDIAKQRSEVLHKMTDPASSTSGTGSSMGSAFGGGLGAIPTLPMGALPDLPAVKATGDVHIHKAGSMAPGEQDELEAGSSKSSAPKTAVWKIRKIWGQAGGVDGATMHAQLSDGNGTLLNVVKGDPLPDGNIIDAVSVKGVDLNEKGPKGNSKVTPLSWDDAAGTDGGSDSSAGGFKPAIKSSDTSKGFK
jgi:hypothetical protein